MYREDSDIADLNAHAAQRPVGVEPRLFALLAMAKGLTAVTHGAFDVTMTPLLRAWGFVGGTGKLPDPEEVAAARERTGMHLVRLDAEASSVHFLREGVTIDLGAIGKGYAIEQAAETLRELEVPGALIHGGTSTVQAVGGQPDGTAWPIAIQHPLRPEETLAVVPLRDGALSVSAVHGKSFTVEDVRYGHVLDPRAGEPVRGALLAAVVCDSATASDALSTALLVLGELFLEELPTILPEARGILVTRERVVSTLGKESEPV
jgi:thiamine biosynthesis lipoprotein